MSEEKVSSGSSPNRRRERPEQASLASFDRIDLAVGIGVLAVGCAVAAIVFLLSLLR